MSFRTTRSQREWAEHGETTIQTIFKQHIGGVTKKKDQREWTDLRPNSRPVINQLMNARFVDFAVCEECATFCDPAEGKTEMLVPISYKHICEEQYFSD